MIAATNKRLDIEIEQGKFRAGFCSIALMYTPLSCHLDEIAEDVPLLVEHFNRHYSIPYGRRRKSFLRSQSRSFELFLARQRRELRNTIERVVIMHPGAKVAASDVAGSGKEEAPVASFRFPSYLSCYRTPNREFTRENWRKRKEKRFESRGIDGRDRSTFIAA